jgi:hypothetical protein
VPWIVPAIDAITTTPIAQREIDSVTRSQTPSQRSSSPGMRTLASDSFSFAMSVSRKRQMKRIVKRGEEHAEEAPRDAEDCRDGVRNRRRDVLGALLHVLGRAGVAEPGELARVAELLHRLRELLQESRARSRRAGRAAG